MSKTEREMREEFERDISDNAESEYFKGFRETKSNNTQIGGDHYKKNNIQTWDFIHKNGIGFIAGNIIKYVVRYKHKNGIEDLKKARHYLDKLIEEESK